LTVGQYGVRSIYSGLVATGDSRSWALAIPDAVTAWKRQRTPAGGGTMATQRSPESICPICSKPIRPDAAVAFRGEEAVHLRCRSLENQGRALEACETARERLDRARTLADRAHELIEEARTLRTGPCPVCTGPLSARSAVLYKGEVLVHAACWSSG
jgi:hypothetical protein